MCDSWLFFWKEELAVSWYVYSEEAKLQGSEVWGCFFPSFYQAICTQTSCLGKWVWVSFSLLRPWGFLSGFCLVGFLFGYFFIQRELSNQLQKWDMWGKRSILVCRLSRTQNITKYLLVLRQIHFIIYGQTEIIFTVKNLKLLKKGSILKSVSVANLDTYCSTFYNFSFWSVTLFIYE